MKKLTVLYDRRCEFCRRCSRWLGLQEKFLELELLPYDSAQVPERFPGLELDGNDLVVVSDEGDVYMEGHAFIMCLWALREYREWSIRLSSPVLLPLARKAFNLLSLNRSWLSSVLNIWGEESLADRIRREAISEEVCDLSPRPAGRPTQESNEDDVAIVGSPLSRLRREVEAKRLHRPYGHQAEPEPRPWTSFSQHGQEPEGQGEPGSLGLAPPTGSMT